MTDKLNAPATTSDASLSDAANVEALPSEGVQIILTKEDLANYKRPDQWLAAQTQFSRAFLKKLYAQDMILCSDPEGNPLLWKWAKMPPVGSCLTILVPPPIPTDLQPEDISLDILYEDEHLLIVNKAAGMVVHPAAGNYQHTLANAALFHCPSLAGIGGEQRPGIVHRLDKGTSGIMVVAKSNAAHEGLSLLFAKHDIERTYQAIMAGKCNLDAGTLSSQIGRHPTHRQKMAVVQHGKTAITHFKVQERLGNLTHLYLTLETGRTHQIRVHLSKFLSPILNDPLYGNPSQQLKGLSPQINELLVNYDYPLLHARVLGFKHPITQQNLRIEIDPPEIFQKVLAQARIDAKD